MALLDVDFSEESSRKFWVDELKNSKILLLEIEKAILFFTKQAQQTGGVQEYTIDTGQDRQTVKRSDLGSLYQQRKNLLNSIAILESRTKTNGGCCVRVNPW